MGGEHGHHGDGVAEPGQPGGQLVPLEPDPGVVGVGQPDGPLEGVNPLVGGTKSSGQVEAPGTAGHRVPPERGTASPGGTRFGSFFL